MRVGRLCKVAAVGAVACSAPLPAPSNARTDGGNTLGPNPGGPVTTCPAQGVTEFSVPTADSYPYGITAGPDGAVWFTEGNGSKIGRLAPDGSFAEFPLPTPAAGPEFITAGADGNLWFTEKGANRIGRITTAGEVAEFSIPTAQSGASGIALGPDGNIWFAEMYGNKMARISTSGKVVEYSIREGETWPARVAAGPDGNLWFTEMKGCVGRITPGGTMTQIMTPYSCQSPHAITAGPDGSIWFTVDLYVDRISPEYPPSTSTNLDSNLDSITETTPDPMASCAAYEIVAGADGNVWFGEMPCAKIGRVTPAGELTEFAVPDAIVSIGSGPDGAVWFTDYAKNAIGCLVP